MSRALRVLLLIVILVPLLWLSLLAINYRTIPSGDTQDQHFDTLIVLGCPSNPDGSPAPEQRERVLEAVRQYRAGTAPHLIMTGGAAHNQFVEAHSMALLAEQQGIPAAAIVEEPQAQNTVQNIWYSFALMQQHGWPSAEVISSPSHLPRAALILRHYNFPWRTDAARWPPEYPLTRIAALYLGEATYDLRLRWLGFQPSRFLPTT